MRASIGFPARGALGAALLLAAAWGADPRLVGAGELRVIDARGQVVGTFLSLTEGLGQVLFPAGDAAAGLRVGRDGFVVGEFSGAVFATDDCTDEARLLALDVLLPATLTPIAPPAGVLPDNRVIVPTAGAPAGATTVESVWRPETVPPCDSSPSGMVPTRAVTVVSEPFVSPFTLVARQPGATGGRGDRSDALRGIAVDGAGQPLGWLGGGSLPIGASVLFEVAGRLAPVFLFGNRAVVGTGSVVYVANNCTGVPFLANPPGPAPMFPLVGVDAAGAVLRDDGAAAPIVVGSESDPFDVVAPCDVAGAGPARPVQATAVLDDLGARPLPFGIALAPRPPVGSPAGRGAAGRLVVEDAAGRPVGVAFTGIETPLEGPVVLIQAGSRTGEVLVAAGRFRAGTRRAHFETSDCGGPALVLVTNPAEPAPLSPWTALGPGDVLYSADGPLDVANLQFRWVPETATCLPDPVGPTFVQRTSVLSDLAPFALPLTVP